MHEQVHKFKNENAAIHAITCPWFIFRKGSNTSMSIHVYNPMDTLPNKLAIYNFRNYSTLTIIFMTNHNIIIDTFQQPYKLSTHMCSINPSIHKTIKILTYQATWMKDYNPLSFFTFPGCFKYNRAIQISRTQTNTCHQT